MMPLFSSSFPSPIPVSSSSVLVLFTVSDPPLRFLENPENLLVHIRLHPPWAHVFFKCQPPFSPFHLWERYIPKNLASTSSLIQNVMSVVNLSQEIELARSSTDATHFGHRSIVLPTSMTIRLAAVVVNVWSHGMPRYTSLEDGRSLCTECMESAIMDAGDCQPLYHAIRDFYEGMNMRIDQQIPMLLVEKQFFDDDIEGKHGFHDMPETTGLCLSEQLTVPVIRKRLTEHCRVAGIRKSQKATWMREVTAILVLYGLPRLLTGAILAHELMHAWLYLKGYPKLKLEVEEGICQVLSFMWLESEVMRGSRNTTSTSATSSSSTLSYGSTSTASSSFSLSSSKKGGKSGVDNKLGEFFMHQIAYDASPDYGEGFRAAVAAVNNYGLCRTLDHIRLMDQEKNSSKGTDEITQRRGFLFLTILFVMAEITCLAQVGSSSIHISVLNDNIYLACISNIGIDDKIIYNRKSRFNLVANGLLQ